MTALHRVISPDITSGRSKIVVNAYGKPYDPAVVGEFADVEPSHADVLCANGWTFVCSVGTTAERPSRNGPTPSNRVTAGKGVFYVDTTLNKVLVHDGYDFHDALTGATVA